MGVNHRGLLGSLDGIDVQRLVESWSASMFIERGCRLTDRVFAKTLQTPATLLATLPLLRRMS